MYGTIFSARVRAHYSALIRRTSSMSPSFKHMVNCSRDSAYSTAAGLGIRPKLQLPACALCRLDMPPRKVFYHFYPPKVKQSTTSNNSFAISGLAYWNAMRKKWCCCSAFSSLTRTACFNNLSPLALFPKNRHGLIAHDESRTITRSLPRRVEPASITSMIHPWSLGSRYASVV